MTDENFSGWPQTVKTELAGLGVDVNYRKTFFTVSLFLLLNKTYHVQQRVQCHAYAFVSFTIKQSATIHNISKQSKHNTQHNTTQQQDRDGVLSVSYSATWPGRPTMLFLLARTPTTPTTTKVLL